MTHANPRRRVAAALSIAAVLTAASCRPQADRRCDGPYKPTHSIFMFSRENKNATERYIATLIAFARENGMEHELNRYPQGVPGHTDPQFVLSLCDEHLYALAGDQHGLLFMNILTDAPLPDGGFNALESKLAVRLDDEFNLPKQHRQVTHAIEAERRRLRLRSEAGKERPKPSAPRK